MSDHDRLKKDGERKDHKNARQDEPFVEPREGVDRPDVHNEKQPNDSFDEDLKRDSRNTPRGAGNDKPLTDPSKPPASR
jgi:hypothetical protein